MSSNLHYGLLYPVEPDPEGMRVIEMTFITITSFHTLLKAVKAYTEKKGDFSSSSCDQTQQHQSASLCRYP